MVTLNTSNIPMPINLHRQEKSFSQLGDWLSQRKEIKAKGFKQYYALIERRCADRGYCYLKNQTIAEDLGSHPKTIQNYNNFAIRNKLITIIHTGRASLFILNYHPWMGITENQAQLLKAKLPENIARLMSKFYPSDRQSLPVEVAQPTENKQPSEPLESILEIHVEKDKEASLSQPYSTDSSTSQVEQKITEATTNVDDHDHNHETNCVKTDIINAGMSGQNITTAKLDPDKRSETTETTNTTEEKSQTKAVSTKENSVEVAKVAKPKGKFSKPVYLDFVQNEIKLGKKIKSVEGLTAYLHREGKQDKQVGKFVDEQKEKNIGGNTGPVNENVGLKVNNETKISSPAAAPASQKDIDQVQRFLEIEKLGEKIWASYPEENKKKIIQFKQAELLKAKPQIYSQMGKLQLENCAIGIIKHEMGEMRYRANIAKLR